MLNMIDFEDEKIRTAYRNYANFSLFRAVLWRGDDRRHFPPAFCGAAAARCDGTDTISRKHAAPTGGAASGGETVMEDKDRRESRIRQIYCQFPAFWLTLCDIVSVQLAYFLALWLNFGCS